MGIGMPIPHITSRHFVRDLLLVFLLLSAVVIGSVAFLSIRAREDISQKYIDNAALGAVRQFESMADTMNQTLELTGDWIASGKASLDIPGELNGLLFPILKRDRILFGISVADTQGNSYYLSAHGDGWRTSETGDTDAGRQSVVRIWDADQQQTSEDKKPATYDARSRPWFSPALSTQTVFWTLPYKFFNREEVGITASIAKATASGSGQTVVAFDILLDDLFREIQLMAPSVNSRVFIFRNDAQLYVPGTNAASSDFRSMVEVEDPLLRKIFASWQGGQLALGKAFSIGHDNATWWCGFRPMESANRNVWVAVMVPESDIIGGVNQRRTGLGAVGGLIVLLAGGLAFLIIRRYGQSFAMPEDRYDGRHPETSIRRLIAKGEGRAIEFKSTMRMNLHTQKPGKEIELAWIKAVVAFMNTDGGTLLIGVTDDGVIAGMDPDGFANDDKCRLHFKNLINQHIGAELSKYLRFSLIRMENKLVGVVSCSRSPEPVFLKNGKTEAFYIRSGPSSDALPVSKVVAYIQNRG
jgi:hypothetical protein